MSQIWTVCQSVTKTSFYNQTTVAKLWARKECVLLDLAGLDREPIRSSESGWKPLERKCLPCISADGRAAGSDSVFKHKTASSQLLTEFWLEKHCLPYFLFTFSNETNISVSLFVCLLNFLCLSLQLTDHISFMMDLTFKKCILILDF